MNNIAENIAPDAAQSVKPPAVGETNAAAEKSHRAQNTGSKARPATKKLNLTQKIIEIKKQTARVPILRIDAKELTEAELNELLAIAPLAEIRAEAAERMATSRAASSRISTSISRADAGKEETTWHGSKATKSSEGIRKRSN